MKHISFLFVLLLCLPLGAQQTYRARVVDAETGESLSFVNIKTQTSGGLSNKHGYFTIKTNSSDEELFFSHVGYESLSIRAGTIPSVIKMVPAFRKMTELIVRPHNLSYILRQIIKRLKKDYADSSDINRLFFMRSNLKTETGNEMQECFLYAKSAVNLRNLAVVSGKNWLEVNQTNNESLLKSFNIQVLLQLGAYVRDVPFWDKALFPLHKIRRSKAAYEPTLSILNEGDSEIFKINMRHGFFTLKGNNSVRPDEMPSPVIIGDIYADKDYRLLKFDGEAHFVMLRHKEKTKRVTVNFQIVYRHDCNFTEVSHVYLDGGNESFSFNAIIFNLGNEEEEIHPAIQINKDNLISAIHSSVQDDRLWELYNIIMRTEEEEEFAKRANMQLE